MCAFDAGTGSRLLGTIACGNRAEGLATAERGAKVGQVYPGSIRAAVIAESVRTYSIAGLAALIVTIIWATMAA